jgi:hypothetical protein
MSIIIARTYSGGRDLCIGMDLTDAKIISQESNQDGENYETILTIKDVRGFEHKLIIVQEK